MGTMYRPQEVSWLAWNFSLVFLDAIPVSLSSFLVKLTDGDWVVLRDNGTDTDCPIILSGVGDDEARHPYHRS